MNKPMTMADVAGAGGPAMTGAGGPVVTEDGGPAISGTRFLAVAEVYSPVGEVEGDPQTDDRKVEQDFSTPEEEVGSHPLDHLGVENWVGPCDWSTEIDFIAPEEDVGSHPLEHLGVEKWAGPGSGSIEISPLEHPVQSVTPCWGSEPPTADVREEPEEGEAIMVGAVRSAAPWFLTGWTNEVEVEFMIDTGCQVTILATSVFEKMCAADLSQI